MHYLSLKSKLTVEFPQLSLQLPLQILILLLLVVDFILPVTAAIRHGIQRAILNVHMYACLYAECIPCQVHYTWSWYLHIELQQGLETGLQEVELLLT